MSEKDSIVVLKEGDVVRFLQDHSGADGSVKAGECGIVHQASWGGYQITAGEIQWDQKRVLSVQIEDSARLLEVVRRARKGDAKPLDWWWRHWHEFLPKAEIPVRALWMSGIQWLVPDSEFSEYKPTVPVGGVHGDVGQYTRELLLGSGEPIDRRTGSEMVWRFNHAHADLPYRFVLAEPTKVIFRVWNKENGGGVIAIFPELPSDSDSPYHCEMYEHVGQGGGGDPVAVMDSSRPAKPEEYAALARELEQAPYHYDLKVVQRISPQMRAAREAAWRELYD